MTEISPLLSCKSLLHRADSSTAINSSQSREKDYPLLEQQKPQLSSLLTPLCFSPRVVLVLNSAMATSGGIFATCFYIFLKKKKKRKQKESYNSQVDSERLHGKVWDEFFTGRKILTFGVSVCFLFYLFSSYFYFLRLHLSFFFTSLTFSFFSDFLLLLLFLLFLIHFFFFSLPLSYFIFQFLFLFSTSSSSFFFSFPFSCSSFISF